MLEKSVASTAMMQIESVATQRAALTGKHASTRPVTLGHVDRRTRAYVAARKLARAFEQQLGGRAATDVTLCAAIERASSLLVIAEDARTRRLAGDTTISLNDLVRLDRVAALAV